MNVLIQPSALADLAEAFDFYERQEIGLGDYFIERLYTEIDSLSVNAGIHGKRFGYFRLLSKRFPFAVYYHLESGNVYVRAVLDLRKDPEQLEKKLGFLLPK